MPTSMVATVLLFHRSTGISENSLIRKTAWLYNEIVARGGLINLNVLPALNTIQNSLNHLSQFVDKKKDAFKTYIKANKQYSSMLMLAYYKNNLVHVFLNEAYIACSLLAFGANTVETEGISLQRLWEQTKFLSEFLRDEFVVRNQISTYEEFIKVINFMEQRKLVSLGQEPNMIVKTLKTSEEQLRLLSSLV